MAVENNIAYDDSSIDALKGCHRYRNRPASVLGSDGIAGARHTFIEMEGNSLDEVGAGFGNKLIVTFHKDYSISVRDFGRGVPLGWNEKNSTWNWHLIYNELYAGGKYDSNQAELANITDWDNFDHKKFNYLFSIGLNGVGSVATQYTSDFFNVKSYRDGKVTSMSFVGGVPIIAGKPLDVHNEEYDMTTFVPDIQDTDEETGTLVHWRPALEAFKEVTNDYIVELEDGTRVINIGADWVFELCRDMAGIAHIELQFINEITGEDITIPAGDLSAVLRDRYGKALLGEEDATVFVTKKFSHGTSADGSIWICDAEAAIGFAGRNNLENICYHNSVRMMHGVQYSYADNAIAQFFTDIAAKRGVKLERSDYRDTIVIAVSSKSNKASFRGQTKDGVDDAFIGSIVYDMVFDKLMLEYSKGNKELTEVVNRVVQEAEIRISLREEAKRMREAKKNTSTAKTPEKFLSCINYMRKNYDDCELWLVEGDSAMNAVKQARDAQTQAVLPVNGKMLNVLKSSYDRIVKDAVVGEIFSTLGTGMDLGRTSMFNLDEVRFSKIIIATDADEDGFQIRTLIFLVFYVLAREIITDGRLFIAETPRFQIKLTDGTSVFARDDAQRDAYKKEYAGRISSISRFKGLGEVNADVLSETTVHPATRNLVPITVDFDDDMTQELIDALFGADKHHLRKSILTQILGSEVAEMLENTKMALEEVDNLEMDNELETVLVG